MFRGCAVAFARAAPERCRNGFRIARTPPPGPSWHSLHRRGVFALLSAFDPIFIVTIFAFRGAAAPARGLHRVRRWVMHSTQTDGVFADASVLIPTDLLQGSRSTAGARTPV
jgi:hypothetical protein